MYNKYAFINNNKNNKKEEINKQENSQISFDMLENLNNEIGEEHLAKSVSLNKRNKKGKNITKFIDNYVLVDIETTGLSPIYDDIIEIGAIKVKNNQMIDSYNQLIKIDRNLPEMITELTGITDEMLKTGKLPQIVLEEFVEFVKDDVIIGHNVNFDLGFLQNKCKKYLGYNLSNDYIDTLFLARRLVPNSINHKLGTLAKLFNISYEGAHRGLKDVEITYELYNKLREIK